MFGLNNKEKHPLDDVPVQILSKIKDRDLAPVNRVLGNFWRAEYFQALQELRNANKGIRRLRAKLDWYKKNTVRKPQLPQRPDPD